MAPCAHYQPIPPNRPHPQSPPAPSCPAGEPPMNRYPHPIQPQPCLPTVETADLHFLRCTLAYQNQLLADIKALLQVLVKQGEESSDG